MMAAGRELFAANGYAQTPREEIVAAAGVTRGALQHHFGDKQSLFQAVYEEVEQEVMAAVARAAMEAGDDPMGMLRRGIHAYLDAVTDPAAQRICAIDGPAVIPASVRQDITNRYALGLVREAVAGAMRKGQIEKGPVEPLTVMLLAGINATAQYVATAADTATARKDAGRTVDSLLAGLSRRRRS